MRLMGDSQRESTENPAVPTLKKVFPWFVTLASRKKNWSFPLGFEISSSVYLYRCSTTRSLWEPRPLLNRPFPSSPRPLYQKCSAFDMEMIFHSHANKTHFHKKGCALGLILQVTVFGTRKWPWLVMQLVIHSHTRLLKETQKLSVLSFHRDGYPVRYSLNVFAKLFFFNAGGLDVGDFAIKLARVNCFDWSDVCEKNNITIYPTIKMFRWVLL